MSSDGGSKASTYLHHFSRFFYLGPAFSIFWQLAILPRTLGIVSWCAYLGSTGVLDDGQNPYYATVEHRCTD